ncbi:hypothetical protein CRG98_024556 [Punica granatum]|uniref:MATH domain-containing protein n=1 Tax=Punica granatum TaxID=22663 RepID=A0A2I0JFL8_PUNGR|nr:hypothetical protein CRG98_024556 [Punica granatum]
MERGGSGLTLPNIAHRSGDLRGAEIYKREYPPAHYSLKINSFSLLSATKVEKYESGIFEAGGYKWSLSLYPKGDKKNNGAGHISLYLAIEETDRLHHGWEVNVNFRFFVLDQARNMYLTIQDADGAVRRFHELKREWGFSQLISLETFNEESNGYLVDDSCVFGAEVFVMKPMGRWESLSMIKLEPQHNKHTWTLDRYSKRARQFYYSDPFSLCGKSWKLKFFPNGTLQGKDKFISLFLELVGALDLPPKRKLYAEYKLRLLDQLNDNHQENKYNHWFCPSSVNWGSTELLPLEDLPKPANGFTYNDTVKVEVEILVMSEVKVFSGGV